MARGSNNPGLHFSRERRPKLRSTERVETPWMYASWITAVRAFSAVRRGSSEVRLIGSNELPEAFATAWQELVGDCRKDLATQGLDPTWFGTNVTTNPVHDNREAFSADPPNRQRWRPSPMHGAKPQHPRAYKRSWSATSACGPRRSFRR